MMARALQENKDCQKVKSRKVEGEGRRGIEHPMLLCEVVRYEARATNIQGGEEKGKEGLKSLNVEVVERVRDGDGRALFWAYGVGIIL